MFRIAKYEDKEIRSVWDAEKEEYYFSVVDVVEALTNSDRARKYWSDLKIKLNQEGSQLSEKIGQLKLKAKIYQEWSGMKASEYREIN